MGFSSIKCCASGDGAAVELQYEPHRIPKYNYHQSETSEGVSVYARSIEGSQCLVEDGLHFINNDDSSPFLIEIDADSPEPVAPEEPILPLSVESDIDRLVRSIRQRWEKDPYKEVKAEKASLQEYKGTLDALLDDHQQLLRILVARKNKIDESTDLFFEQVRFRTKWQPRSIEPGDIPNALPSGAWRLCGYSREGCIVSNYKLRHWDPNVYGMGGKCNTFQEGVDEYVRYVCFMIELMISKMHPDRQQFVVLFDLAGFTPRLVFRRNVRIMITKLIYVAQAQYPERLRRVLLMNAPFGFESAWKLIRPLLDEKTAGKIHFCHNLMDLGEDIDLSVLSAEYGGTHSEYPVPK